MEREDDTVVDGLIEVDPAVRETAPLPWAVERLASALDDRGAASPTRIRVELGEVASDDAEAFRIERDGDVTTVRGPHARGLGYGVLELADRLENAAPGEGVAAALGADGATEHSPAVPVRGVLRSFSSDVLDLDWLRDPAFWTGYLDELAVQRINRVQLALGMQYNFSHDVGVRDNYLCFAYPFLLEVPGWDVQVGGVTDEDRAANLAALRFASDEAVKRGIAFQLGLWNHAVQPELGESPQLRYPISGLPDEDIPAYSATALHQLLEACPSISGVTFRVHYEGGVPEVDHGEFWGRVMSGIRGIDRPIDIDMHAKGVDAELLEAAASAGERVALSPKYWAEHQGLPYHQARVRDNERARPGGDGQLDGVTNNTRRFTRYGYGDFLGLDRREDVVFRIWPGTQRFLLWADPATFAGYGRWSTIGGSRGVELCEQLTFRGRKGTGEGPRDLYTDAELHRPAARDWEKYRYGYRLWGRLLYEPDADPSQWRRYLARAYGEAAASVEEALSAAGRILPLVTVGYGISASNNYWWPEGYWNLPMYYPGDGPQPYDFDTPAPYTWPAVSPFDPELFATTDEFVDDLLAGRPTAKRSAVDNAVDLEELVARTEAAVAAGAGAEADSPLVREALVDARLLAGLGRMFAERIRAGIDVALHDRTGEPAHLQRARDALQRSRDALAGVVETASAVYVDDLAFGDRPTERGAWRDRLAQLDAELADIDARIAGLGEADPSRLVEVPGPRAASAVTATSADDYEPGSDVTVEISGAAPSSTVELHHRPLDQSAEWAVVTVQADAEGAARAVIPGSATAARYPLTWYVVADDGRGPRIVPGLGDDLCGRPYAVLTPRP